MPRRIVKWFQEAGFDAVHTMDLPDANRTTDAKILEYADREGRAVGTKDADFINTHLLHRRPEKLFLISTGNISNPDLEKLMKPFLTAIARELMSNALIELDRSGFTVWQS